MKKLLIPLALVAVLVAVVLVATGGDEDDAYMIRAIFDNSNFLVEGEEVRVAGATVGTIEAVDVTVPGEIASYDDGRPQPAPGKAVLVMKIEDPGFQDFRRDATCVIRPQSLIGEKFIDCRPTIPRAPGTRPAPPLREIPEGQPGEGQYLLPLENNSSTVDPDLINNINRLPYAQRFRLILNELGAGLAGRGEDLKEAIERSNPVLRDVNRLLGTLSEQRNRLAQLSADSQQILSALARERQSVAGFFSNAGAAAEASAERGPQLEASFRKLPAFLREFRATIRGLEGFSNAAAPVFTDLGRSAPAFTRATRALAPFSAASTVALRSLGATGEQAGPILRAADPVVVKARNLARSGARPTTDLAKFFVSTKKTGGWDGLVDLIYNTTAAFNEFDQYGHFGRALITLSNCTDYVFVETSGCSANFHDIEGEATASSPGASTSGLYQLIEELQNRGGEASAEGGVTAPGDTAEPAPPAPSGPLPETPTPAPDVGDGEELEEAAETNENLALLDYLLAP
ncbi:MAG TPA: MlaD family protein [Solirubrobacterales bacterium]|nr:MlaD family protein [Solirubrobacterales bacterium]